MPLAGLPADFTNPASDSILGIPVFVVVALIVVVIGSVVLRYTRFGRQVYAVGSNPEAARILGIRSRLVVFAAFSICGLLAGVAGVMWVQEFGTINGTSANGVTLAVVAAVVVGGVNIFGGSGTVAGAAIGAHLPRVHRQRAHPRGSLAVLAPGDLRPGDPRRRER